MHQRVLFLPGILAGAIFFIAMFVLATMVDGYSHVTQTVSEIGRQGSPAETYLQIANSLVAICLLVFAWGLFVFAKINDLSKLPALFMASYAVAEIGVAAFPSPHPLHNVFGLSMIIGYATPLVLGLAWKNLVAANYLRRLSLLAFGLIAIAVFLNLSPLFARDLYPLEIYGIVQRMLFVAFFGWCMYAAWNLYSRN
jgi:hypothetical membrane protein